MTTTETPTVTEMTATEIANCRNMERERFILWHDYIAASNLYTAMIGKPNLFDEDWTNEQSETCRRLKDLHSFLDQSFHMMDCYAQSDATLITSSLFAEDAA